jgi:Na+/H+ antiporter NhaC
MQKLLHSFNSCCTSFLGHGTTLPSVLIFFGAVATFEEVDATKDDKIGSIYSIVVATAPENCMNAEIIAQPLFLGLGTTLPSILIFFGAGATFEEMDATKDKIGSIYSIVVPACCT